MWNRVNHLRWQKIMTIWNHGITNKKIFSHNLLTLIMIYKISYILLYLIYTLLLNCLYMKCMLMYIICNTMVCNLIYKFSLLFQITIWRWSDHILVFSSFVIILIFFFMWCSEFYAKWLSIMSIELSCWLVKQIPQLMEP